MFRVCQLQTRKYGGHSTLGPANGRPAHRFANMLPANFCGYRCSDFWSILLLKAPVVPQALNVYYGSSHYCHQLFETKG